MESIVSNKSSVLIDNWSLKVVADYLSNNECPSNNYTSIYFDKNEPELNVIKAGVFQIECLISLLEQIVFSDEIILINNWTNSWENTSNEFNSLINSKAGIIKKITLPTNNYFVQEKDKWLKSLINNPKIQKKYTRDKLAFENGEPNFWFQIIEGIADYLTISDKEKISYSPHPVRKKYLQNSLWQMSLGEFFPNNGIKSFNKIIDTKRIELLERVGNENEIIKLSSSLPASSLLCLAESTSFNSPINIAVELRNDKEVIELRKIFNLLNNSIYQDDFLSTKEILDYFESLCTKIESKVKLRKEEIHSAVNFSQIKCNINNKKKDKKSTHNGIVTKLIHTGNSSLPHFLMRKFKVNEPQVLIDYLSWNKKDKPIQINMSENYYNYGTTGAFGKNAKFENSKLIINHVDKTHEIDTELLAREISILIKKLQLDNKSESKNIEIESLKEAKICIEQQDNVGLIKNLKKVGKWTLDAATNIGTSVTASLIQKLMEG